MNKLLFLFLFLSPFLLAAQTKSGSKKKKSKSVKVTKKAASTPVSIEFIISGTTTGFADGTVVNLLNGNSGQPEQSINITNGKFEFKGALPNPDFKIITFQDQQDYITMFIQNERVAVNVNKNAISKATVKGSESQTVFEKFILAASPYAEAFAGTSPMTDEVIEKGSVAMNSFIAQNVNTFIIPLAIFRSYQLTGDEVVLAQQFSAVDQKYLATPLGQYVANIVAENAKHPIGKAVIDFAQADTTGKLVNLSSFKGKYVLLDFWASWCRPCRQENPNVVAAYNKFKSRNFTILGVSLDQTKQAWLDAIVMDGLTWTHVSDLKGWGNSVAALYNVGGIPQNFLIDPNGILIGKNLRGEALNKKLEKLLKN